MGASMSTVGGWAIIFSIGGYYLFRYWNDSAKREAARLAAQRQRLEDRHSLQARKENKAKKQRVEAFAKDVDDSDKASKPKQRPSKASTPGHAVPADDSTDDGLDNREFARQLASVKQGTAFAPSKKTEEKRQKSVKQSRAQEMSDLVPDGRISAPSSTAGADADDDQSPFASPEFHAVDAGNVADMLERPTPGPSVLRLTDTDKVKTKEKKAPAPEVVESKKARQHKKKAEEAKMAREEAEKDRKVRMEAQRRLARISEGRAAKDGSTFVASKAPASSAWTANGTNGKSNPDPGNGEFLPVQPLDTFEPSEKTDASKSSFEAQHDQGDSWMSSLPSEEEQMEMLREEEAWSMVKTKKSGKGKKKEVTSDSNEESAVAKPQKIVPVTSEPMVTKTQSTKANGRPAVAQQSSFAALSTNDGAEEEWDV